MTTTAHTPRPWSVQLRNAGPAIVSANNELIVSGIGPDLRSNRANAALIVKAVNSHEELLALARRVAEHYGDTDAPLGLQARAALDKAEETPCP